MRKLISRRSFLKAAGVTAGVAAFAGCGNTASSVIATDGTGTSQGSESSEASGEKTKLLIWTNNRADSAYVNEKIDEFNQTNEFNIELEYVIQADSIEQMLTMAKDTGNLPDIFTTSSNMKLSLDQLLNQELVIPLNDYITDDFADEIGLANISYEGYNTKDGNLYTIFTVAKSGRRLIYNKDLFEKAGIENPPVTLAEMVEDAKKITEIGDGAAYGMALPGMSIHLNRLIIQCANVSGVYHYDFKNGKFDFTGFKPFVLAVKDIIDSGSMFPGYASMKIDPLRVQFSEGNIGMYGNSSQEVSVLTNQFPAKIAWDAAPVPSLDGEIKGTLALNLQTGFAITPTCKAPEAAWTAIQELFYSEEYQVGYFNFTGEYPFFANIKDQIKDQSDVMGWEGFKPLSYEGLYPLEPKVSPEGQVWLDGLWEACQPGGPDVDATIEKLNESYNKALDEAVKTGTVQRLVIKDYDPMNPSNGTMEYLSE